MSGRPAASGALSLVGLYYHRRIGYSAGHGSRSALSLPGSIRRSARTVESVILTEPVTQRRPSSLRRGRRAAVRRAAAARRLRGGSKLRSAPILLRDGSDGSTRVPPRPVLTAEFIINSLGRSFGDNSRGPKRLELSQQRNFGPYSASPGHSGPRARYSQPGRGHCSRLELDSSDGRAQSRFTGPR
eukprot:768714-Hanusia_phi.AAC.6